MRRTTTMSARPAAAADPIAPSGGESTRADEIVTAIKNWSGGNA
jgi:hypothetical protein